MTYKGPFGAMTKNTLGLERGGEQRARLNFFLASGTLYPQVTNTEIITPLDSDHCPVTCEIELEKFTMGKGLWKCNDSLLKDENYIKHIRSELALSLLRYAKGPNDEELLTDCPQTDIDDFLSKNNLEKSLWTYNLDSCDLLRIILNDLQNASIQYASNKKRLERENILEKKVRYEWLMRLKTTDVMFTEEMQRNLEIAESEYREIMRDIADKNIINDRIKHRRLGERATAYFCNLEKNQSCQKFISRLRDENNVYTNSQESVNECIRDFYKNLYTNKDDELTINNIEQFLGDRLEHPVLTNVQARECDRSITLEELSDALKTAKTSSAPGFMGFSY